jgi:hypothetical protein
MPNRNTLIIAGLLLTFAATSINGQTRVYRWVDQNGMVHYADTPPGEASGIDAETIEFPDVQTSFRSIPAPAPRTIIPESLPDTGTAALRSTESAPLADPTVEECGDPSPTISAGRYIDDVDVEPEPLAEQEVGRVIRVLSSLHGRWTGPDTGFYCVEQGAFDEQRPFDRMIEAEGDFNPPESFVLDSTIRSQGSNRRELFRIEIRDQRLRVNTGAATLISASERALDFGYRLQVAGVITEYYWRVALTGTSTMNLQQWIYTHGELSASSFWQLTKQR